MTKTERGAGHAGSKVSTVDIKRLCPSSCVEPYGELEYRAGDEQEGGRSAVTWWVGRSPEDCEERWSMAFDQSRQKKFEIPGVPYEFVLVNGQIYYRRNVEDWTMPVGVSSPASRSTVARSGRVVTSTVKEKVLKFAIREGRRSLWKEKNGVWHAATERRHVPDYAVEIEDL